MTMRLEREEVRRAREEFFAHVMEALGSPPKPIDDKLEQFHYYHPPMRETLIADADYGDFYVEINPSFGGTIWPLAYSMWQIGLELRLAIILHADSEQARWQDAEEFDALWPNAKPTDFTRGERRFFEWRFDVPDFHTNFAVRERFALGMRHAHFRVLKALRGLAPSMD